MKGTSAKMKGINVPTDLKNKQRRTQLGIHVAQVNLYNLKQKQEGFQDTV
jgi:hypothetical protein